MGVDIGHGVDELFSLLDRCKRIYMPVLSDEVSVCKVAHFENLIRIWDFSQILAKTTKMHPPFHASTGGAEEYINHLIWSELGDYVKEILRKERE